MTSFCGSLTEGESAGNETGGKHMARMIVWKIFLDQVERWIDDHHDPDPTQQSVHHEQQDHVLPHHHPGQGEGGHEHSDYDRLPCSEAVVDPGRKWCRQHRKTGWQRAYPTWKEEGML